MLTSVLEGKPFPEKAKGLEAYDRVLEDYELTVLAEPSQYVQCEGNDVANDAAAAGA